MNKPTTGTNPSFTLVSRRFFIPSSLADVFGIWIVNSVNFPFLEITVIIPPILWADS